MVAVAVPMVITSAAGAVGAGAETCGCEHPNERMRKLIAIILFMIKLFNSVKLIGQKSGFSNRQAIGKKTASQL